MISRRLFVAYAVGASLSSSLASAAPICSGVDPANGDKPALVPSPIEPSLAPQRKIPDDWRKGVLEIIARFEAGTPDIDAAYANVSSTDVISLGFLQWNHNAGSLYTSLLGGLDETSVESAPVAIREDLLSLKRLPPLIRKREGAKILANWRDKSGKIKADIKADLQTWLRSASVKAHQDQMLNTLLSSALGEADGWQKAAHLPIDNKDGQRAFYYFVDMKVFSGSLDGLWVEHVRGFREKFSSDLDMLQEIKGWVEACGEFHYKGKTYSPSLESWYKPEYSQVYRRRETRNSVNHWVQLLKEKSPLIDQTALNLIALGYLRALRSTGNDAPNGMAGVFRLDVLNRRGIMAVGEGFLPGDKTLRKLFSI
jgi:hypothetical protein